MEAMSSAKQIIKSNRFSVFETQGYSWPCHPAPQDPPGPCSLGPTSLIHTQRPACTSTPTLSAPLAWPPCQCDPQLCQQLEPRDHDSLQGYFCVSQRCHDDSDDALKGSQLCPPVLGPGQGRSPTSLLQGTIQENPSPLLNPGTHHGVSLGTPNCVVYEPSQSRQWVPKAQVMSQQKPRSCFPSGECQQEGA